MPILNIFVYEIIRHPDGNISYRRKFATCRRMNENLKAASQESNQNRVKIENLSENTCLSLKNVSITTPDGKKALIKDLSLDFVKNKNVLISGKSGSGKTGLFRCINGLWKSFTGEIILNADEQKNMFFLPQTSYFTCGSLLEQISYPSIKQDATLMTEAESSDQLARVTEWLKLVDLDHLLEKVNFDIFSKPTFDWSTVLSAGTHCFLTYTVFHNSISPEIKNIGIESLIFIFKLFLEL